VKFAIFGEGKGKEAREVMGDECRVTSGEEDRDSGSGVASDQWGGGPCDAFMVRISGFRSPVGRNPVPNPEVSGRDAGPHTGPGGMLRRRL
jgi:hypothetical protein